MNLQELIEQRKQLVEKAASATTNAELDEIEIEMRKLNIQIEALEQAQGSGEFNPINTFRNLGNINNNDDDEDMYSSMEYRKAFKDYILKGTPIPEKFASKRAAGVTLAEDIGAVIPTTILNKIIEDITEEGEIFSRVTKTSYPAGVQIPISEVNITASWINDGAVSGEQKAKMDANILFAYNMLEARVPISLLAQTVSLPVFETTVMKQIKKAMMRAIEEAIISGTGSGQPKGITKYDDLPAEQVVEMDTNTAGTVKAWATVEAAIPTAYDKKLIYIMHKSTWEMYLNGMTDSTGQKIGIGKINEKGQKSINGREVLLVDYLPTLQKAETGNIFAIVCDLGQYMLNSNLEMYYSKYYDQKENKYVHKAIAIVDGQMAIGKNTDGQYVGAKGLIYVKKKEVA